jgi:hypothetical protein
MKALLQAGLAGRVPVPPEKRFLISSDFLISPENEMALFECSDR